MQTAGISDVCSSPHAPDPATERAVETSEAPASQPPSLQSASPQDSVTTPSHLRMLLYDLPPQPPASRPDVHGFKFSPVPMCYHARKRSNEPQQPAFLFQQRIETDSEDGCSPKERRAPRGKIVSFSTAPQTESERSMQSEDKENEEIDLTDSLEVISTVAKGLPNVKTSVSSSYVVWHRVEDFTPLGEKPKDGESDHAVSDPRPSKATSVSARTSPLRLSVAPPLMYCPACDKDSRTLVLFETAPVRGLQSLVCCWRGAPKTQVMSVHKCVTCKRVIARLVQ